MAHATPLLYEIEIPIIPMVCASTYDPYETVVHVLLIIINIWIYMYIYIYLKFSNLIVGVEGNFIAFS